MNRIEKLPLLETLIPFNSVPSERRNITVVVQTQHLMLDWEDTHAWSVVGVVYFEIVFRLVRWSYLVVLDQCIVVVGHAIA